MAKTQWTPGPWREDGWYVVVSDEPIRRIAVEGRTDVEAMSNAHLIATAPELYEALDRMTSIAAGLAAMAYGKSPEEGSTAAFMDREYPSIRAAMNLLAKARGEA